MRRTQDNSTLSSLIDVDKVKEDARQTVSEGPVTSDYPLDVKVACGLLNDALATEILCVLRYRHHQIVAKGINSPQVADEFKEHAESEQEHMLMIAERINQLGGDPDFSPESIVRKAISGYGKSTDLRAMIQEDLIAERVVIEVYHELIEWFGKGDPTTRRMLEDILADEEEHASDLSDLLALGQGEKEQLN